MNVQVYSNHRILKSQIFKDDFLSIVIWWNFLALTIALALLKNSCNLPSSVLGKTEL